MREGEGGRGRVREGEGGCNEGEGGCNEGWRGCDGLGRRHGAS